MPDYRKVIALGRSTYCLTLPKEWVLRNNIAKGSAVLVKEQQNGTLMIAPNTDTLPEESPREITINITAKEHDTLQREIIAAYIQDYTDIILIGDVEERLDAVKAILQDLLALEIMSVTKTRIVTKVFLDTTHTSLENVLKRMDMINRTLFEQTTAALEQHKTDILFETLLEVDRLCYVALRCITRGFNNPAFAKQLKLNAHELLFMWQVIYKIKKIAERIHSIRVGIAQKESYRKLAVQDRETIVTFFKQLESLYRETITAYHKHDRAAANQIIEAHTLFRKDVVKLFSKPQPELAYFAELTRRASTVIEDIAIAGMEQF